MRQKQHSVASSPRLASRRSKPSSSRRRRRKPNLPRSTTPVSALIDNCFARLTLDDEKPVLEPGVYRILKEFSDGTRAVSIVKGYAIFVDPKWKPDLTKWEFEPMGKGWSIKTWRSGKKGPLYLTLALPTGMVVGKPSGHAWDVKVEHKDKSGVRCSILWPESERNWALIGDDKGNLGITLGHMEGTTSDESLWLDFLGPGDNDTSHACEIVNTVIRRKKVSARRGNKGKGPSPDNPESDGETDGSCEIVETITTRRKGRYWEEEVEKLSAGAYRA